MGEILLMKKRLFVAIFGLLFVLLPFVNTEALAFLSIVTAKQCPLYLVLEEKDGTVSQAYLGTPAGSFPIKSVEGYRPIQEVLLNAKNDDGINRFLWRLEFAKPDDPIEVMQLWVAYIPREKTIEVASGKTAHNEWYRIASQLPLPDGVFLFVSYEPDEQETPLSHVFTITLTKKGLAFVPIPEVYEKLIPLAITFSQSRGTFDSERTKQIIGCLTHLAQNENVDNIARILNLKKEFKATWH